MELDNITQLSNSQLVEAAQQGDLASFGRLYERHYRMAVGIARSRVMDAHLAEDVAQEAFSTACQSLAKLQDKNRFPQWLATICRRTASRVANSQATHESLLADCQAPANGASLKQDVAEALALIDGTSREIVLLHYFSGLTYIEIANVLELTPQAIHGRLQRARAKLSVILAPDEETAESAIQTRKPRKLK